MSEYLKKKVVLAQLQCDDSGCERVYTEPNPDPLSFIASEKLNDAARDAGWSCWRSRGRRHYCPDHGPKPGHSMWRIY